MTSPFRVDRLVAHGASGGQGFDSTGRVSRASTAVSVVALSSGDEVYMVIGQEGTSACNKLSRVSPRRRLAIESKRRIAALIVIMAIPGC